MLALVGVFWLLVWAGMVPGLRIIDKATIKKAKLIVWGTTDDAFVYEGLIKSFQRDNPGVEITYV